MAESLHASPVALKRRSTAGVRYDGRLEPEAQAIRYDGVHCNLLLEKLLGRVLVLKISGTDVGEFGEAPMKALTEWLAETGPVDFFIDAREVRGASIAVSAEWAAWLSAHKDALRSVTMLTGSRFIQVTAEFVRRFASLEGIMRICTEPAVFDRALEEALVERAANKAAAKPVA